MQITEKYFYSFRTDLFCSLKARILTANKAVELIHVCVF